MTTKRPLTADEHDAFALARMRLLNERPYYASAAFAVKPVAADGLGTWAVDKNWRLYIDPAHLPDGSAGWGVGDCADVFDHELNHLLRGHAERMEAHAGPHRDHGKANIACDAEINDDLNPAGFVAQFGVTPSSLGLADNQTAEFYYDSLPDQDGGEGQDGSGGDGDGQGAPRPGHGNCGSGAGGTPIEGELDEADPMAPGVGQGKADLTRKAVAKAVTDFTPSPGQGNVPAGLQEWARLTLTPPTVPWQRVLAAEVRRGIRQVAGLSDYTYGRVSRRSRTMPGIITPAMVTPKPRIAAVVDTSGSMSSEMIHAALNEVHGIAKAVGATGEDLTLIQVDAAVASVRPFTASPEVRIDGRGGTDMRVGITAGLEQDANVIIVLTDGFTPWPDERPRRAAVVAAIIGEGSMRDMGVQTARDDMPWARVVEVG